MPPLEADEGALGVLLPLFPPLSIPEAEAELALSTLLCWCTLLIMEAKGLCMCIRWCPWWWCPDEDGGGAIPAGTAGSDCRLFSMSCWSPPPPPPPPPCTEPFSCRVTSPRAEAALTSAEAETIWGTLKSYLQNKGRETDVNQWGGGGSRMRTAEL